MKVTKLPSGNYRCRVYVGKDASGKKLWKSITGPDKKRVVLEASKFSVERDASVPVVDTASFRHAADTFLGSHESVLSPLTYRAYKSSCGSTRANCPCSVRNPYTLFQLQACRWSWISSCGKV